MERTMLRDKPLYIIDIFSSAYFNITRYGLLKTDIAGEIDGETVYRDIFNRFYFIINDTRR